MITASKLQKLSQPSTWAGIAILLSVFGVPMTEDVAQSIVQSGVALSGLAAIFLNEKGAKNENH